MATFTSVTNGLWSSTGTWGTGTIPGSGDIVNIVHRVTYDTDNDTAPINTVNVNTNGTLQWTGSATRQALRISLLLNQNGGAVSGTSGTQIRIHEGGSWQVKAVANSHLTMSGSEANSNTISTARMVSGDGHIDVLDSAGFGSGDYVNVFDNIQSSTVRTDEVFQIHSVQANRLYVRRMVGASITLAQDLLSGTNAIYSTGDVRCLRPNSKIVIDNAEFTVASLDVTNNIIYTVESSSGTYTAGMIGYESGAETEHSSGDRVVKLCATIVGGAAGNNYVDVGCAGGFVVNDTLGLGGCAQAQIEAKVIQSISPGGGTGGSDRITFTSNLTYNHTATGLVVKLNRDCVFIGTTDETIRSNAAYIYILSASTASLVNIHNFEMRYVGNTASSLYAGFVNRSAYASNVSKKHTGCVIRHSAKSSTNGFFGSYSGNYLSFKNCVAFDVTYGLGSYSYSSYTYVTGGIAMGVTAGFVSYSGYTDGLFYNFVEGATYGMLAYGMPYFLSSYLAYYPAGYRYLYCNYVSMPFYADESYLGGLVFKKGLSKNSVTRRIFAFNNTEMSTGAFMSDIFTDESWRTASDASGASSVFTSDSWSLLQAVAIHESYQGISTKRAISYYYGYAETDESIKFSSKRSWKFSPSRNNIDSLIGFYAVCRANQGKTILVRGFVRKNAAFTGAGAGTGPGIYIRNERCVGVASVVMSNINDTWVELKLSYTFPNDEVYIILMGGYGASGNFWIDVPQIYANDCYIATQIFEDMWQKKNFNYDGCSVVLGGTTL